MSLHRHNPSHKQRDPLFLGLAVVAGFAAVLVIALTHSIPFVGGEGGRRVNVTFTAARQVTSDTPVRLHGVPIGRVEAVRYDAERGLTDVTLRLDEGAPMLRRDASAALRWRTVLGGRMEIALDPGTASEPPIAGGHIPVSRTRIQTELEDLTQPLDGDGGRGLQAMLQELPKALEGRDAGRFIDALRPGLEPLAPAMRALRGERDGDLQGLVHSGARSVAALERARGSLGDLVSGLQLTLRTTAANSGEIERTLETAPGALDATVEATRAIDRTLPDLDGLVADLRPGARQLGPVLSRTRPTLVRLQSLLHDARPLLARLGPAVEGLGDASVSGRRLVAGLDPTVRRLASDLLPWLKRADGDLNLPVYQLVGPTFATLAAAAGQFNDIGHTINFPVQPGENSLSFLPCTTYGSDPTAPDVVRCAQVNRALRTVFGAARRKKR